MVHNNCYIYHTVCECISLACFTGVIEIVQQFPYTSGVARSQRFGGKVERVWGTSGPTVGVRGPEAEKHDINFALRITLVNAYCPFIAHIILSRL